MEEVANLNGTVTTQGQEAECLNSSKTHKRLNRMLLIRRNKTRQKSLPLKYYCSLQRHKQYRVKANKSLCCCQLGASRRMCARLTYLLRQQPPLPSEEYRAQNLALCTGWKTKYSALQTCPCLRTHGSSEWMSLQDLCWNSYSTNVKNQFGQGGTTLLQQAFCGECNLNFQRDPPPPPLAYAYNLQLPPPITHIIKQWYGT